MPAAMAVAKLGYCVLMPCRALEAFRPTTMRRPTGLYRQSVLMPCRALEAFRRKVVFHLPIGQGGS